MIGLMSGRRRTSLNPAPYESVIVIEGIHRREKTRRRAARIARILEVGRRDVRKRAVTIKTDELSRGGLISPVGDLCKSPGCCARPRANPSREAF
jgi:hypothetical protein